MSRFGNIFYLSVLFGGLWGAIWTIIITLLALFIFDCRFNRKRRRRHCRACNRSRADIAATRTVSLACASFPGSPSSSC